MPNKFRLLGRFRGPGDLGVCGTIGNGYSFAHAKYGTSPQDKQLVLDQTVVSFFVLFTFKALGVESPREGAITILFVFLCIYLDIDVCIDLYNNVSGPGASDAFPRLRCLRLLRFMPPATTLVTLPNAATLLILPLQRSCNAPKRCNALDSDPATLP